MLWQSHFLGIRCSSVVAVHDLWAYQVEKHLQLFAEHLVYFLNEDAPLIKKVILLQKLGWGGHSTKNQF